jgi:hypothetical protein
MNETIRNLRSLNTHFYGLCFSTGVGTHAHGFIEFNGLMSKYIDLLEEACRNGFDPHEMTEHSGRPLPAEPHDMEYLAEKLRCMFGPVLDSNPKARAAFIKAMGFGPEVDSRVR